METTVAFTPTPDEAARLATIRRTRRRTGLPAWLVLSIGTMQLANGLLIPRDVSDMGGPSWLQLVIAFASIGMGLWCYGLFFRVVRREVPLAGDVSLRISEDGIAVDAPHRVRVPWSRVVKVERLGEALVFDRRYGAPILVLMRALPGDGSALWTDLDRRFVGSRYLRRGSDSGRTIVNTNALG